jgi:hypothetical protein
MHKPAALIVSLGRGSRDHPEIYVVAGCLVTGTEPDGREIVERATIGQVPLFWGHYRLTEDGRQQWIADYDDRQSALVAARADAGNRPIYFEDNGVLTLVSLEV